MAASRSARDEQQPLAGLHIAITRPPEQAQALASALAELGARVTALSTIAIAPLEEFAALDAAASQLAAYDWVILTSVNGVAALAERLATLGIGWPRVRATHFAVIGPATAAALEAQGVTPDLVPDEFIAEAIAARLGEVGGQYVLLLRADIARKALADDLRGAGAQVDEVAAYRTVVQPPEPTALQALLDDDRPDAITLTSSSTVLGLLAGLAAIGREPVEALKGITLAAIGPITAATMREHGLAPSIIAHDYTIPGLVRALVSQYSARPLPR